MTPPTGSPYPGTSAAPDPRAERAERARAVAKMPLTYELLIDHIVWWAESSPRNRRRSYRQRDLARRILAAAGRERGR